MNDAGLIIHDRSWMGTDGNSDHVMRQHPEIGQVLQNQGYASDQQCTKFNANTEAYDNHPQLYKAWKVKCKRKQVTLLYKNLHQHTCVTCADDNNLDAFFTD